VSIHRMALLLGLLTDAIDLQNELFWRTLSGRLNLAPLPVIHRALDMGTGTGIWAIDFGKEFLLSTAQY
jgi:hypothetical protein